MRRRNSLRYPGYDYRDNAGYFVTLRVQSNLHLFGIVDNGEMHLSEQGQMVRDTLLGVPNVIAAVAVDAFMVMPNHLHALLIITPVAEEGAGSPRLGSVVGRFKTLTMNRYIAGVNERNWPRFDGKLWQRNFHDHIVRSDKNFEAIRAYIEGNPGRWQARMDGMRSPE